MSRIAPFVMIIGLALPLAAQPVLSGTASLGFSGGLGSAAAEDLFYGSEQYANIRLRSAVGERGTLYAAVNLAALSGLNALSGGGTALEEGSTPEGFVSSIELERLYFRMKGEKIDSEFGLMRVPFGYGQAFRPMDILNPPNPLFPDARPRGVPAASAFWYPAETTRLQAFAAAPSDALRSDGGGFRSGISVDSHGERLSAQALYSHTSAAAPYDYGLHRLGLALKLEAGLALVLEGLYTLDPSDAAVPAALELTAGADYSFFDGKLMALAQYLYYDPLPGVAVFADRHYLFIQGLYQVSDYTGWTASALANLEDRSCSAALGLTHELFQGYTVALSGRLPLDSAVLGSGEGGEFGPERSGYRALIQLTGRIRF